MKKLTTFLSVLAAALLLSALPAFSGTGPFGAFGPSDFHGMNQGVERQIAFSGGTGPYGVFGPTYKGVDTRAIEVAGGGTGPYGTFGPHGMYQWGESHQVANKDECLLVAMNCPPDSGTIQDRIDRLNGEIAKGTDVYTPSELKVLNDKLNSAYRELDRTNSGY